MTFSTEISSYGDDSKSRFLIEQGDMGYRPGDKFPVASGVSERGQIWRATMGATLEQHLLHEQYLDAKRALSTPKIFTYKIRAGKKLAKMKRIDARRHNITEVSLCDPDILPRHIKGNEFINLYSAIEFANSKNSVFNVHLTINWRDLGFGNGEHAESQLYNSFIRQYTEWCRDNDVDCIWIYSNESSDHVGLHTHFMTSVRKEMLPLFERFVSKRMSKINRHESLCAYAFKTSIAKSRVVQRQWIQFQYLCKGVDQNARLKHANGIDTVYAHDLIKFGYESPGEVTCKRRCGLSRNIDKKIRDHVGFMSTMEKGLLNVDLLYGDKLPSMEKSHEEIMGELC